jgi:steroid 5-alpha reductase family enzyme
MARDPCRSGQPCDRRDLRKVRHPQYAGIGLVVLGALIQWPTLLTLAMAPVLLLSYVRLGRREERELEARFGEDYRAYRKQVLGCIPRWRPRHRREERSELVAFADRQRPEAES